MTDQAAPERHEFQAQVTRVLDIVIHSLYSNKEIFLRELVSNASDAVDKLRFRALTDHDLLGEDDELGIWLLPDAEAGTLTIQDNGIGMTHDELVENLGTIARSGSQEFLEELSEEEVKKNEVDLIGQFGVGFYSSFLVAERVEVRSRAAGSDEAWKWSSAADGSFTLEDASDFEDRGTEIKLFLKSDQKEYGSEWRLKELVRRYSDFVAHPIKLRVEKEEGEGDEKKNVIEYETVNQEGALWTRPRDEISDEQYEEFYRHVAHDYEAPLGHTHFKIEGTQLFTGLLYVPKNPPFDLYDRDKRRGVRLHVKRVFIMDDCSELLPEWLRFVRGVIDSDDLPLNVSRELLQSDKTTASIKKNVIKKTLDLLESMAKKDGDDYANFWKAFGSVFKEGLHFEWDDKIKSRVAKLCRFTTTESEFTSLDDYIERMKPDQESIYYVIGASRKAVEGSPYLEALKARGFEVILLTDAVDEWAVGGLPEYEEKKLVSAMKADLDLDGDSEEAKEKREKATEDNKDLVAVIKGALEDEVSEVRVSSRLTDSPCCLVIPEHGHHAHIEQMLRAQGQDVPKQKRILEINPDHQVIQGLKTLNDGGDTDRVKEWVALLHDQALLAEGSPIEDPQAFAKRMTKLMTEALPAT